MICPHCGTNIPDGSAVCPACSAEVAQTTVLPRLGGAWCPGCGALLPEGATTCPSCGMPVTRGRVRKEAEPDPLSQLPEVEAAEEPPADELEETHAMPRIESAIPEAGDGYDRLPRIRTVLVCALASLALVGGIALLLTHPWDPNAYATRATEARDTSQAGFPGVVERLTGQDSSGESSAGDDAISAEEATYQGLSDAYDQLGELDDRIGAAEAGFEQAAFGGDAEAASTAADEAEQLSYDVSNLISDVEELDGDAAAYDEDVEHLVTLGNWLRNRVDALNRAWDAYEASSDPASERDQIMAPLTESQNAYGVSTYKGLFDQNYEAWEPQAPSDAE